MRKGFLIFSLSVSILYLCFLGKDNSEPVWQTVNIGGDKLRVKIDTLTKTPRLIFGFQKNITDYGLKYSSATEETINKAAKKFLYDYVGLLKITPEELKLRMARKLGNNWSVSYWQTYRGLLIYQSTLGFLIDAKGGIGSLGAILYKGINIPIDSKISQKEAIEISMSNFRRSSPEDVTVWASDRLIYPQREEDRIDYFLAYTVNLFMKSTSKNPLTKGWVYFVGARSGNIIRSEEIIKPCPCCTLVLSE